MADEWTEVVNECGSAAGRLRIFFERRSIEMELSNLIFKYQIYILLDNTNPVMLSFRKLMNCIFEEECHDYAGTD